MNSSKDSKIPVMPDQWVVFEKWKDRCTAFVRYLVDFLGNYLGQKVHTNYLSSLVAITTRCLY